MRNQIGSTHREDLNAAMTKSLYRWVAALMDVAYRRQANWSTRLAAAVVVVLLLIGSAATVYATGGTRFAYPHMAYIPVVVAAFLFGLPGGIVAGAMAGLALGPFMPLDAAAGTAQPAASWLIHFAPLLRDQHIPIDVHQRLSELREDPTGLARRNEDRRLDGPPAKADTMPSAESNVSWPRSNHSLFQGPLLKEIAPKRENAP